MKKIALALVFVLGVLIGFSIYAYHFNKTHIPAKTVAALEPPPDYLDIKGERWNIWHSDLSGDKRYSDGIVQATTSCTEKVIRYDPSSVRAQSEYREVIWHEVVHAEHCGVTADSIEASNWGEYTHDDPDHAAVYELGMFLPGFVHDNPDFMKWAEDWK